MLNNGFARMSAVRKAAAFNPKAMALLTSLFYDAEMDDRYVTLTCRRRVRWRIGLRIFEKVPRSSPDICALRGILHRRQGFGIDESSQAHRRCIKLPLSHVRMKGHGVVRVQSGNRNSNCEGARTVHHTTRPFLSTTMKSAFSSTYPSMGVWIRCPSKRPTLRRTSARSD